MASSQSNQSTWFTFKNYDKEKGKREPEISNTNSS